MSQNTPEDETINRRNFLKRSSTVGGIAMLPNVDFEIGQKSKENYSHGSKRVIDAKITYSDEKEVPVIHTDNGRPDTFVHNNELYLLSPSPTKISKNENLLRSPFNLSRFDSGTNLSQDQYYVQTSYDGRSPTILNPESSPIPFQPRIKIQNTEAVVEMGSELLTRVPDGEEKKIELPDQKFEIKEYGEPIEQEVKRPGVNEMTTVYPEIGTKTVILQPELSIRNNGELNIVGHARGMVLPNINEPPVRSIVASNRANKQTKMELTKEKSVVFMEKDPNYRGQFDRGGCN